MPFPLDDGQPWHLPWPPDPRVCRPGAMFWREADGDLRLSDRCEFVWREEACFAEPFRAPKCEAPTERCAVTAS